MKIYNILGIEILDIAVTDDSYRYRVIMGENALTIMFSMVSYIDIPVGSYVDYQASRYTLLKPQNFTKNNTRDFEYTLILDGPEAVLSWFKLRDFSGRLKFSHTAKPQEHLQLLVDNLNERDSGWSVGSYVDSVEKVISFNHTSCNDALRQMAEAFNTEFEIIGKQISLRRVEYNKANPLALSYGFGNGFKSGVKRENSGDSKAIEILYVQGGERNISPTIYGSQELLLPKSKTLKFDGSKFEGEAGFVLSASREYVSSADGAFIKRNDKPLSNKIEDSLDCSNIYPSRVGVVSGVEEISSAQNFYDILDNQIPATLDYHECLIEGEKMTIVFQSGMLAGREFDCSYVHNDRRFKIVPQEIDGMIMPSDSYLPQIGDSYAIFGIQLPTDYISNDSTKTGASWDMFREAVRYMYSNEESKFTFSGELDPMWASTDWVNIGGKIKLGGFVSFTDSQFQTTPALIRIVGVRDYINNPHKPQIELSNVTSGGGYGSALKDIANTETIIENAKKEVVRFAKRGFREAKETAKMLENSLLNFSGAINPVTVQTMQLLVGDESLQFEFVANQNSTAPIPHNETFNPATKQFTSAAGIIQHKTLGITDVSSSRAASDYKWWSLPEYVSAVLDQQGKSYYLYAKVSKTNNAGTFILSETAIAMEQVSGFFHLFMGILNSENDGDRSYSPMYGYSELTPGRLMIKKLISPSGNVYFDLDKGNGDGEIAGNIKFRASDNSLKTVEQAIDEVEVGGRNLIFGTNKDYAGWGNLGSFVVQDGKLTDNNNYYNAARSNNIVLNNFDSREFVLTCDIICASNFYKIEIENPNTNQGIFNYVATNGRNVHVFTIPTGHDIFRVNFYANNPSSGSITIENIDLKNGNKSAGWTPAPEDTQKVLDEMSSDNKLTAQEKSVALKEWQAIQGEYTRLSTLATQLGVSNTLSTPYTNLANYINPLLSNMTVTSDIVGSTFRSYFTAYYNASTDLQNALTSKVQSNVSNLKPAGKNYLIGSRMDSLVGWNAYGGTMSVVTDAQYGKVVEYSRPAGGGDFMKVFSIDTSELKNTELVYYCIAKPISGTTIFNFGGWNETFTMLNNNSPYRDLGNGWRMYYKVFTAGSAIASGVTFGLNSVGGTWRFHSFGVAKGNTPPADWDASPKEIDFLKQGYQASTDIQGGVVQTAILLLRNLAEQVTAGMSGLGDDNIGMWAGGTYQEALNSIAKIILRKDGSGQLAGGNITWDAAGALELLGKITAGSGKIGGLDIFSNSLKSASMSFSETPVESLASLITPASVSLGFHYTQNASESNTTAIAYTQNFVIPWDAKIKFRATTGWGVSWPTTEKGKWTVSVKQVGGSTVFSQTGNDAIGNQLFEVSVPAGTYVIEVQSKSVSPIPLGESNTASASITGESSSTIYAYGYNFQTKIGNNGFYSFWDALKFLYYNPDTGIVVRGATDIPAGLGGASISSSGGVFAPWGKIAGTGQVVKSGSNYTITHNIGDTNYSIILTPKSTNVPYFLDANRLANTIVVTCAGGFDFVLIRTK